MTHVDKTKLGICTSTQDHTQEEILVEREVQAQETPEGFLFFQVDNVTLDPPILLPKEKFLALFERGGEEGAKETGKVREEGQSEGEGREPLGGLPGVAHPERWEEEG